MNIRWYIDPETGLPHIDEHDVTEQEVIEVLQNPLSQGRGTKLSRKVVGQTSGGRYLKVVYVPDPVPNSIFVITSYPLSRKALKALKRQRRKKQ